MHVMRSLEIQQTLQGKVDFQKGLHSHFHLQLTSWACSATIPLQIQRFKERPPTWLIISDDRADLDWALKNLSAGWYQTNRSNDEVGQTNGIQMTDVAASCHAGLSQA